jgi:hypothetical protein
MIVDDDLADLIQLPEIAPRLRVDDVLQDLGNVFAVDGFGGPGLKGMLVE